MKKKPFRDFDWVYNEKTIVQVDGYTTEIWHDIGLSKEKIEEMTKNIIAVEKRAGHQIVSRYDMRSRR